MLVPTIEFILQDIHFEWNDQKAITNIRKHNISFERACEAFFDPFLVNIGEEEYVDGELREKIIGMTHDWRLLYIAYVLRSDRIRVISAREATAAERLLYETQ